MTGRRETLGDNVIPSEYHIELETDLKRFVYKGNESIKVKIRKSTRSIKLNATDIKVKSASVKSNNADQKGSIKTSKKDDTITINIKKAVSGNAVLSLDFEGTNDDSMRGFYRSKYEYKGKTGYILTTQFEPADARKAFPCFDEPAFKATFDLSLVIDATLDAVSNMPVKSVSRLNNGRKRLTFRTTPRMSSYLLYMGVGKFEHIELKRKGMPTLRVITVPGKSSKAHMAIGFCEKFLKFYESYFGIKFPLPKIDLLAVPDFSAGAMENWGAITFREIGLLGDEKTTSVVIKQWIAGVIAHELVHQWFGDLVTMKWWDDLWLNESFATFMSSKAVESAVPKWEYELQSTVDSLSSALGADQYISTHPINVKVTNTEEINEIFDEISYQKGGCVLAMLEDYAGKENFRKGLHLYLKKHSYSNASKEDLWNAIAQVLGGKKGKDLIRIARSWIDKAGYPVVSLQTSKQGIELRQSRFLMLDKKLNGVWPIPLHYATDKGEGGFTLMEKETTRINAETGSYINLNHGRKGLYRVQYPEKMLDQLGKAIKAKRLKPIDAWGIEKDLFSLARSSRIKVSKYLDFVERYCMDSDYPLDSSVSGHLNGLLVLLSENARLNRRVKSLAIRYHSKLLKKLGWKGTKAERNVTTMLRSRSIASLGRNGYKPVISRSKSIFSGFVKDGKAIDPNLKSAVYAINTWHGNIATYNKFIELFKKGGSQEDQRRYLQALGQFNNLAISARALSFSLSKDVRLQDSFVIPAVLSGSAVGRKIIWKWTKRNWKALRKRYVPGAHMLERYVHNLEIIDDPATRKEIASFFSKSANTRGDVKMAVKQALELIDINIRFKEFNRRQ